MDNNIYYKIEELHNNDSNDDNNDNYDNYDNNDNIDNNIKNYIYNEECLINELKYNELSIKNINIICDYYKIKRGKLSKKQKIMEIIFFENNINNIDIVENRKLLWEYMKIIKTDKFLKNYIVLDM